MPKQTGPFPIQLGTPLQEIPPDPGVPWSFIVISNLSPLLIAVEGQAWLQPWTAQLYPVATADTVNLNPNLTTNPGTTSGNVTIDWYLAGETVNGTYPAPLFSQAISAAVSGAVTAAVTGSVTANQPQTKFAASPFAPGGAGATTFPWPAGGPYLGVSITLSNAAASNTAVNLEVSGGSTGEVFLNEIVDHGTWFLPISSVSEPNGVTLAYGPAYGFSGAWTPEISLVAVVAPQVVRPVYGPGDSGPTAFASGLVVSNGTTSVALAGTGSKTNTIRIWAAYIAMEFAGAGVINSSAYINVAGVGAILTCVLGSNGAEGNNATSLTIPGGIPLSISLNAVNLVIDATAVAFGARGGILYSYDSS